MEKLDQYPGLYYFMGFALDIMCINRKLAAAVVGIPQGFEMFMEPKGDDVFRIQGGPLHGSSATFTRNSAGDVVGLASGPFQLAKVERDSIDKLPVTQRLPAPEPKLTLASRAYFEEQLQSCLKRRDGAWIDYELPYPKHEFVQYVTARDLLLFHGSNNTEIKTFEPVRRSVELRDETGRGNLQAVYATHDGLWAMFFAVVDRKRLKGSIRNGVMTFNNRHGEQLNVYNFSINQEQLVERPYTAGALYFLPRHTFSRLKLTDQAFANEWASEKTVPPLAKLLIEPEDFPFLEQIAGHDDSELVRLATISENIRAAAMAASLQDDQFEVTLPSDAEVVQQLNEYTTLLKTWMTVATLEVRRSPEQVTLLFGSLPPAMQQTIRDDYHELLSH